MPPLVHKVLPALGFDDDRMFVREFDDKVRIVVVNVAIGVHVIELEMHGQIVLCVGQYV
jgi:hypothetical protein